MSIFSDILSAITTRGRRIQIKMGLKKDFNDSKLKVGELGLIIDEDEVRIGLANGTTKKLGGLDVSELPNATTTTKGIVQLSSSTSSTSTTLAATPSAVKQAYDLANTANGKTYTLPSATSTVLGGVKVGVNIDVTSGTVSVANASTSTKGVVQLNDTLTSTSTSLALTAKQGNELKKLIDNLTASSGGGLTIADIPIASATQDGLMTKAMVSQLNQVASKTTKGLMQVGDGLNVSNGIVGANYHIDNDVLPDKLPTDFLMGETVTIPTVNNTNEVYAAWRELAKEQLNLKTTSLQTFRLIVRTVKRTDQLIIQEVDLYLSFVPFGAKVATLSRVANFTNSNWYDWQASRTITSYHGNPNGVVYGYKNTLLLDTLNGVLYRQSTGEESAYNSGWVVVGGGSNFVQVEDSVTSTSTTRAASAYAVKQAYDLANTAKTLAEGSGTSSVNIYQSNISKHSQSNAIGHFTTASGTQSTAMGANTTASGSQSTAMGMYATASGTLSTATGYYTVASGKGASANGNITTASDASSFAIGSCNKAMSGSSSSFSTSNTALLIGNSASESSKSNAFRVMFNGASYGQSAFNSTGADYAEYFEWLDSNPDNEDRVGYFVALNGEKIEIANSKSDYIIGVISANPSVIGDSYQDQWQGMYVTDEWGRIQNEYIDVEYEELDKEGNTITKTRQDYVHKLNPNYDNESEYIPREQRKEWSAVGMLGKLLVRDDGTCEVNGYTKVSDGGIATKSDNGYRVIKRVDENIVQIIFK